jgi:hypothetical protein
MNIDEPDVVALLGALDWGAFDVAVATLETAAATE